MCNVVGWANCTTSMNAFEAAFVVRSSIHRNLLTENLVYDDSVKEMHLKRFLSWIFFKCGNLYLLSWIDSVLATETLVSGSNEHGRDFS